MGKSDSLNSGEPRIYLDSNGITVKCTPNCPVGFKQYLNGIEYEVVDNDLIRRRIDEGVDMKSLVTSMVTDMSSMFKEVTSDFIWISGHLLKKKLFPRRYKKLGCE
ncbi:MAG: hypothetical protein HWE07_02570 [Cytophagia bacterium]|nr:hypothetical protein [Cytophagia bacterium]